MQLNFEIVDQVGTGKYPDVIHFPNTQAQVFSLANGELFGLPSEKIVYGDWAEVEFQRDFKVSPDSSMSHFQVDVMPGFGIIGGYKSSDTHKLIIYEYAFEMDKFLEQGSIKHSIDNPISSFTLSLENPDVGDPERPGNLVANEKSSLLSPGAKVTFKFGAGDELPEFDLGAFYVDRSEFTLFGATAKVDGRNLLGKALKDQSLDENHEINAGYIHSIIEGLLENANLNSWQYLIEPSSIRNSFSFDPNTDYLKAIEEIIKVTFNWQIKELPDGTIVVGSPTYYSPHGVYLFERNKDIFSRKITRDDQDSYRRVCVHADDFNVVAYQDVTSYAGWDLRASKTLYVQLPDGIRLVDARTYAAEVASRLESVGKIESFTGPFRPHLQVGDEARILDGESEVLGLITEIEHSFGKGGFYTNFAVDSGGTVGKGRLSDYISQITRSGANGTIGYDD